MQTQKFNISYSPSSIKDSLGFFNDIHKDVIYAPTIRQAIHAFKFANPNYTIIKVA